MISMRIPPNPHANANNTNTAPIPKAYRLSLLNVNEFTIDGVAPRYNLPVTSITGLRIPIRQICRHHTRKAIYDTRRTSTRNKSGDHPTNDNDDDDFDNDQDENDTTDYPTMPQHPSSLSTNHNNTARTVVGKWRIPLSAYQELAGYLMSIPHTRIIGIPANQLQIASLERTRQERGYPNAETLVEYGIPLGLAKALAPFQRGGVDFVHEKKGRALIADGTYRHHCMYIYVWKQYKMSVAAPSYTDTHVFDTVMILISRSAFFFLCVNALIIRYGIG